MIRTIIKYAGLALVIIGIILVMKNLFNSNKDLNTTKKSSKSTAVISKSSYNATVSLVDQESKKNIAGATLTVKDKDGNVVSEWTSEEGTHLVPQLKPGTYTLKETKAPEGYHLNDDGVTFEIKNKDKEVIMYNVKMTEEEKVAYEKEQREKNTTSNEINVDNTLSEKGVVATIMAIACMISGLVLVFYKKEA